MMNIKQLLLGTGIATLTCAYAGSALAQQTGNSAFSYNYLDLGYTEGEIFDEDYSSYGARAAFSISSAFFLKGSYSTGESDRSYFTGTGSEPIEVDNYSLGLGYHTPLSSNTDLVAGVSYLGSEGEFAGFEEEGDGYGANLGVRTLLTDNFEIEGGINYVGGDDIDGEVGYDVTARLYLTDQVSLNAGYAEIKEQSGVRAGIRLNF